MTERHERVLERLAEAIEAAPSLEGAILLSSLARGGGDEVSDVDLIAVVRDGSFEQAWSRREALHGADALASWDDLEPGRPEIGGHKWLNRDLVLVECLLATPASGVRLAEPFRVLAGDASLPDRLVRRPPIERADLDAYAQERHAAGRVHDVERAYAELARAVRAAPAES